MRVGIDATVLAQPQTTGIARLVRSLIAALAQSDADCEFTLLYRLRSLKHPGGIWKPPDPRFRIRFVGRMLEHVVLPSLDVIHSTYQRLPVYHGRTPYLGTLHDIFFASHGQDADAATRERWTARYRDVVRRSRLIMTLSEYSKHEIVDLLGADAGRVRVVFPAAAPLFRQRAAAEVDAARQRYGLDRPYVLFTGGIDPRKNAINALRAFAAASPRMSAEVCFALAGGGNGKDEALPVIPASLARSRVRCLGFVPDEDFAALMSGCHFFFFPTLFEGFGLPALEAMSCGAAVVSSSTTSLPEVCGDAASLVDPTDVGAMADAIVRVANDAAWRAQLRQRGLERATRFTWSRAARETMALYREIAASGPPL